MPLIKYIPFITTDKKILNINNNSELGFHRDKEIYLTYNPIMIKIKPSNKDKILTINNDSISFLTDIKLRKKSKNYNCDYIYQNKKKNFGRVDIKDLKDNFESYLREFPIYLYIIRSADSIVITGYTDYAIKYHLLYQEDIEKTKNLFQGTSLKNSNGPIYVDDIVKLANLDYRLPEDITGLIKGFLYSEDKESNYSDSSLHNFDNIKINHNLNRGIVSDIIQLYNKSMRTFISKKDVRTGRKKEAMGKYYYYKNIIKNILLTIIFQMQSVHVLDYEFYKTLILHLYLLMRLFFSINSDKKNYAYKIFIKIAKISNQIYDLLKLAEPYGEKIDLKSIPKNIFLENDKIKVLQELFNKNKTLFYESCDIDNITEEDKLILDRLKKLEKKDDIVNAVDFVEDDISDDVDDVDDVDDIDDVDDVD